MFTFNKIKQHKNDHKIQQNRLVISFDMTFAMILVILNEKISNFAFFPSFLSNVQIFFGSKSQEL